MDYEYVEENIHKKGDMHLQYNPVHKQVQGTCSWWKTNSRIHGYSRVHGRNLASESLLPDDPYERALARFWIKFEEEKGVAREGYTRIQRTFEISEEKRSWGEKVIAGDKIGSTYIAFGWIAGSLGAMEEVVGVKLLEAGSFPRLRAQDVNFKEVPVIEENIHDHNGLVLQTPKEHVCCINNIVVCLLTSVSSIYRNSLNCVFSVYRHL